MLPAAVRDYYGRVREGYRKNPEGNGDADPATAIEFLLGIAHYLGLEAAFDGVPGTARTLVEEIGGHLVRGLADWPG